MPFKLIPSFAAASDAALDGLIKDARPDFNAFAPCSALIPPSFIAVRKNARSSTLPPSCLIIGATLGIAFDKSSRLKTVWFSTELRKSIVFPSSADPIEKAFCNAIVVSNALSCATPPRTASLLACFTTSSNCFPELPAAAASAAIPIVSATLSPYLVYSFAMSRMFLSALSVSP